MHRRLQVYPTKLTPSNILLAQPLPTWLSNPLLPRFRDIGIFTINENGLSCTAASHSTGPAHSEHSPTSNPASPGMTEGTPHNSPNHVLINEYPPGIGIMPHEDGDAYAPVVATVTLGGHCVLDLYSKQSHSTPVANSPDPDRTMQTQNTSQRVPSYRILQEPRSLLITRGHAYKSFLHGIADVHEDVDLGNDTIVNWNSLDDAAQYESGSKERALRVSLTFRDVLKVSNVGSRLFGKGK